MRYVLLTVVGLLCSGCIAADIISSVDTANKKGEAALDYEADYDRVLACAKENFDLLTDKKMHEQKTQQGFPMLTDNDLVTVIVQKHPEYDEYTRVRARIGPFSDAQRREKQVAYLEAIGKHLGIEE